MIGDADRHALQIALEQCGQMKRNRCITKRQIQHLVEVTIMHMTLPTNRDQGAAHDALQVIVPMGTFKKRHIVMEFVA
jgi:hypothetical protein